MQWRRCCQANLDFSIADVGILIGLYHAPGIALALPGGAFGQRFGDKATVLGALALMLAGGVLMALAPSWPLQITGRLVAGAGAAIMSVVLTKMLTDWFAGKETATAMAIFINSWPVGSRCRCCCCRCSAHALASALCTSA